MSDTFAIRPLSTDQGTINSLCSLLIDVVTAGGSVSFMHPLSDADARAFWTSALAAADRGSRVILGCFDGERLVGTASLLLECPPNQPHRAEIAKMMTSPSFRGKGIARRMLLELEQIARKHGRSLINLDTAAEDGGAEFYEIMGYTRGGVIPKYAYKPHGGLTDTIIYWKFL